MAASGPGTSDLKRLFALSGNRCAFPKCAIPIIEEGSVVADVCHIKGEKPGAARHDSEQTDEQRHSYENLILLCKVHHAVVDDDEESYTVERLHRMKTDHENRAAQIEDGDASRAAAILLGRAAISYEQSGGITAHTVKADTINVQGSTVDVDASRGLQAIDGVWEVICRLKEEFRALVFIDTVLAPKEINDFFEHGREYRIVQIQSWADEMLALQKMKNAGCERADRERPFISNWLWGYFFIIRAVYGRLAYLFSESFVQGRYKDWHTDNGMHQILRHGLPSATVEVIKAKQICGIQQAIDELEAGFLKEADRNKSLD